MQGGNATEIYTQIIIYLRWRFHITLDTNTRYQNFCRLFRTSATFSGWNSDALQSPGLHNEGFHGWLVALGKKRWLSCTIWKLWCKTFTRTYYPLPNHVFQSLNNHPKNRNTQCSNFPCSPTVLFSCGRGAFTYNV